MSQGVNNKIKSMRRISKKEVEISIRRVTLIAHYHRVLFWKDENLLLLSDPHFGKVNHFRKNGIPIPGQLMENNFQRLEEVIGHFKPKKILILGDLFHSVQNQLVALDLDVICYMKKHLAEAIWDKPRISVSPSS